MKKFLLVVSCFALAVVLVMGLFFAAVSRSGEGLSAADAAARMATGEELLYGTAYRNNARVLKQAVASQLGADFLVLGSSRCMQLRSEFFAADSFYNAGGGAGYSNEYLWFLQSLPEDKLPGTLLLQLDQFNYQEQWGVWRSDDPAKDYAYEENPYQPLYATRKAMVDWAAGKFRLGDALANDGSLAGIAAVGRGSGFRSDGSYDYGRVNEDVAEGGDEGFADTLRRIDFGVERFEWDSDVYPTALWDTEELLSWCQSKNITVVAFLAPYAPAVLQKMQASGNYGYLDKLPAALEELCGRCGYEFYDFTGLEGTADEEYIDGYHGSDRVYCRLALHLARQSQALAPYLDAVALQQMLEQQPAPRGFVF